MILRYGIVLLLAVSACACNKTKQDGILTLKDLEGQTVHIKKTPLDAVNLDTVIAGYQAILSAVDDEDIRRETILRLADLEIERQDYLDSDQAESSRKHQRDYSKAIQQYQDFIKSYPDFPGNDHVLYQLAKAYELNGDLDLTLKTLKELTINYPSSAYVNEANFRRGELQFVLKSYIDAAASYTDVIAGGDGSYFYEKALYKQGWALYKSNHPNKSLQSFTSLLDRKLNNGSVSDLNDLAGQLNPGDLELVDDTLRVISLIFSSLNDTNAVVNYFAQNGGREYEFLIYQHLGRFYMSQERIKDAADTYYSFVYAHPYHRQSPTFELSAIESYKQGRFTTLLLNAKEDFVNRYQINSAYWKDQPDDLRETILAHIKEYASELAQHDHALAQKTRQQLYYDKARHWYQIYLALFPDDATTPDMNFLLAELLFENGQYSAATHEYEKTAYDYDDHAKGAEAGYSALLAYNKSENELTGEEKTLWRRRAVASSLRFADRYPRDDHVAAVLAKSAGELFDLGEGEQAAEIAHRVIEASSRRQSDLRQTAWTIIAHTAFDAAEFDAAEEAYVRAIKLLPKEGNLQTALRERLAASIYKQGEQARTDNDLATAANHFLRVGKLVPSSSIRATAEYDAATMYITLKEWNKAIAVLEKFRKSYPGHLLQGEVTAKLAVSYLENGDEREAAAEFESIAAINPDEAVQRDALLQAAGLYQKIDDPAAAINIYKQFVTKFPQPLEQAIEVRNSIAGIYLQTGQTSKQKYWLRQIVQADKTGGDTRTNRTLYLAAQAAFELAKYDLEYYQSLRLTAPLQKNLKKKKKAMENTLEAYDQVLEYNVAEMTTASSYQIASIYADFSKALLNSQRPRGLSDIELEQYDILLEEQAFPFEEEAITAHEINTQRTAQGIYDEWVKKSFDELAKLLPVRYAKTEKSEDVISELR